jgi:glycine dehydrogenase
MGSQGKDKQAMLDKLGFSSLDELVGQTVPKQIRLSKKLTMDPPMSESEALNKLKGIMSKNKVTYTIIMLW